MGVERSDSGSRWMERLIPLPKQIEVQGEMWIAPQQVSLELPTEPWPVLGEIKKLLGPFAAGKDGPFVIRVVNTSSTPPNCTEQTREALRQVPNADQAYAIEPRYADEQFSGLLLTGNTPAGLLHAARTLAQLVPVPDDAAAPIEMPCVTILDWPDIAERGQWGGNVAEDIEWTSRWKLNTVEVVVQPYVDDKGLPAIHMSQEYIDRAQKLGVKVVPYISHLEQVALRAGLMGHSELTSTPDPTKPVPGEYIPGLCMSSSATIELVGAWMAEIARLDGIEDVEVWLSEDRAACFCDRCRGEEPFELEVKGIAESFEQAKALNPSLHLWYLLSQGSYPVNDKVLAVTPRDVGVTYYDGGRTYDSSHAAMIYPLLEDYARSGRWLGVYPQITHAWRTVFPWTAPQFIHARAQEFSDKDLRRVIGYAVPDNRHHEFNVTAWAEWTWNANGRTPDGFCRAYARAHGIGDPALYAQWATKAGKAGWWLAESRLFLRSIYDPRIALREIVPTDMRFQQSDLLYERGQIEGAHAIAREALDLARRLCDAHPVAGEDALDETEALCAGLEALLAIDTIRPLINRTGLSDDEKQDLSKALDVLDSAAAVVSTRVSRWGARIDQALEQGSPYRAPSRLRDTANVLLRVCDALRERTADIGLPDPHAEHRLQHLGTWSARDLQGGKAALDFDVTRYIDCCAGTWFVGFDYVQGDYGVIVEDVTLALHDTATGKVLHAETVDGQVYVGRWERWHEIKVVVPEGAVVDRATLTITMSPKMLGESPQAGWECDGQIGLRRGWPEEAQT